MSSDNVIRGNPGPVTFRNKQVIKNIPGWQDITQGNWSIIEKTPGMSMVEFWRENCSSCDHLVPILQNLVDDYKHAITFYRVECTEGSEFNERHNIVGFPTVNFYYDGRYVGQIVGAMTMAASYQLEMSKILEAASNSLGVARIFRRATDGAAGNAVA